MLQLTTSGAGIAWGAVEVDGSSVLPTFERPAGAGAADIEMQGVRAASPWPASDKVAGG